MRYAQLSIADQWSSISANMAKMVIGFGSFVGHLYKLQEQQYLFACFALGNVAALDANRLRAFARAIMGQKRHVLLGNLLGQRVKQSACQVLYKLGPAPYAMIVYRDLLTAISINPIGQAFGHAQALTATVVSALPDFVEERLPITLLHLLASRCNVPLVDACILLTRALSAEHRVEAFQALAVAQTPQAIGGWFDRWMLQLDFPAPPFVGTDLLRPICNFTELVLEGRVMRHCISRVFAEDVIARCAFAYHWSGSLQATVLLRKNSVGDWRLSEVRGIGNRWLDPLHQRAIADSVESSLDDSSAVAEPKECDADRLWLLRALSRPLPAPPIKGTDLLIPIVSAEDLLREHQDMGIPFDNFWLLSVLKNTAYFFRWREEICATVLAVICERSLTHFQSLTRGDCPVAEPHKSKIMANVIQNFADAGYEIESKLRKPL